MNSIHKTSVTSCARLFKTIGVFSGLVPSGSAAFAQTQKNNVIAYAAGMGRLAVWSAIAVLAMAAPAARATVIIADNFSGTAGTALIGRAAPTYNSSVYGATAPKWNGHNYAVLNGSGAVTNNQANLFTGVIATPNQTSGILTLSADVSFGGMNSTAWIGLTFAFNATSTNIVNANNTLLFNLSYNGTIALFKNGAVSLKDWSWSTWGTGVFDLSATYNLKVEYDRTNGLVDVFVDGRRINETPVEVGALTNSTFGGVGFGTYNARANSEYMAMVSNFQYSVIPEPGTFALLTGGLVLCGVTIRHRMRG